MAAMLQIEPLIAGQTLHLSPQACWVHGPVAALPKKFARDKALASSLLNILADSGLTPASFLLWGPSEDEPLTSTLTKLAQASSWLHLRSGSLAALLQLVLEQPSPTLLIATPEQEPSLSPGALHLALALEGLEPEASRSLYRDNLAQLRQQSAYEALNPDTQALLLEERPGKLRAWLFAAARQEAFTTQHPKLNERGSGPTSFDGLAQPALVAAGSGWACTLLGTAILAASPLSLAKRLYVSRVNLELSGFFGEAIPRLCELSLAWAGSCNRNEGVADSPLTRIYGLTPAVAIMAGLRQGLHLALQERAARSPAATTPVCPLHFPDFSGGWAPALSLIEFLQEPEGSQLLIDLSLFPEVLLVFTTTVSFDGRRL